MIAMDAIAQKLDDEVTVYLRRTGQTQALLASKMQLSELQFSRKRRGEAVWKLSEFLRLCEELDVDPVGFFAA